MEYVICRKFNVHKEATSDPGAQPLFGFAVMDYIYKYDLKPEDTADFMVFGSFISLHLSNDEIETIKLITSNPNFKVLAFCFHRTPTASEIKNFIELFNGINGFTELEDVYENRIVFARK